MNIFKDLSVRTKFILTFILNEILLMTAASIVFYYVVMGGINRTEDYYLENEFYSVEKIIEHYLDGLLSNVRDYANWDEMYEYVNTRDEKWAKTNIAEWIPKNFQIDLILVLDNTGKIIYQYGGFEEFLLGKDLSSHSLIKKVLEAREEKGFYTTKKGIILFASSQIMHTDESGPRNGTYLYGTFLRGQLEEFKAMTRIDLSLIGSEGEVNSSTFVGPINRLKDFKNVYDDLSSTKFRKFNIYKPDYQFAFIYSIVKDIEEKDIGMLELIRPRKTVAFIRSFIIKIFVALLILMSLAGFITVFKISSYLLKPLEILKKTVEEIIRTKNLSKRVVIDSYDEVGILAGNFNKMMDTLNNSYDQLVQAQAQLIEATKMTTAAELAMGTVHQINNPLSIVIGRVQMLRRVISYKAPIPESDLEKDLKIIEEQTRRAVNITNTLLRYAQPVTFRFEKCDINELLRETIGILREQLEAEKIKVVEKLKIDLPSVEYCDMQQMRDVFINIIRNTQQSMTGEAGELEISTDYDEKEGMVWVKFKDNGCGIPPENMNKLFTPFFSTKADSSGLGLAISYNIVKGHRGKIEVESQVGVGSIFTVKLPVGGG